MTDIRQLLELSDLAKQDGNRYTKRRAAFARLAKGRGKCFVGITGPRGVGKTVMLKQLLHEYGDAIYVSIDTLRDMDLFEVVKLLNVDYNFRTFLLDEVHYADNIHEALKKIYDFLDVRICFTSSVALAMQETAHDLSRRVRLQSLYPFSFREFLDFKIDTQVAPLDMKDLLDGTWQPEHLRYSYLFADYLKGGLMPFALEDPDILPLLSNILDKVLTKDIPRVAQLRIDEVDLIRKMLTFIGRSPVDGISHSSISRNIGITKYKAEGYVRLLQKAFILNPVFPAGTNVLREPKVLMSLPYRLLYRDYNDAIGALREDYAVESILAAGTPCSYLKTKRGAKTPDYLTKAGAEDLVIEVGGKGKGREQFKGITVKRKLILVDADIATGLKRPLFMLGYVDAIH